MNYLDVAFWIAHVVALVGWLALFIRGAPLVPFARAVSVTVAVGYTLLFFTFLHDARPLLSHYSLDGVAAFLGSRPGALVGWIHYLAFDLFVGTWEAEEAERCDMPGWATKLALVLTFMVGPLGLCSFVALRKLKRRRLAPTPRT